jgi:hypothetical protein
MQLSIPTESLINMFSSIHLQQWPKNDLVGQVTRQPVQVTRTKLPVITSFVATNSVPICIVMEQASVADLTSQQTNR